MAAARGFVAKVTSHDAATAAAFLSEIAAIPEMRTPNTKAASPKKEHPNGKVPGELVLSTEAKTALQKHIDGLGFDCKRYKHTLEGQNDVYEAMIELGLHIPKTEALERDVRSKYSIKTGSLSKIQNNMLLCMTRFYQCLCGAPTTANKACRLIAWKDVGCWAWARVTTTHLNDKEKTLMTIDEILGVHDHTPECEALVKPDQKPIVPLAPYIRDFALDCFKKKIPLMQVHEMCREKAVERWGDLQGDEHHRYRLTAHDSTSLYQTIARKQGIPQHSTAEQNLHCWLCSDNPEPPSPLLTQSVLFYQPYSQKSERFVCIISTPEMQEAAWKYGDSRHLFTDLTFGFCAARANLMILMALDEKKRGIPIALFVFTARESAKAVHADYNGKLIGDLLEEWKVGLGKQDGRYIAFQVGTTDNDTKERNPLAKTFPNILLLLCMFHVWKCWKAALNTKLRVIPIGEARTDACKHLAQFLMLLLKKISGYKEAIAEYNAQVRYYRQLAKKKDELSKKTAKGALAFLEYLHRYLQVKAFWLSWSMGGVIEAAKHLGIPEEVVPRTTNHVESFNWHIKDVYWEPYQHAGRLPRLDVWILLTITKILPSFFAKLRESDAQGNYYTDLMTLAPKRQQPSAPASTSTSSPSAPSTSSNKSDQLVAPISLPTPGEEAMEENEMLQEMISVLEDKEEDSDPINLENLGKELVVDDSGDASFFDESPDELAAEDAEMEIMLLADKPASATSQVETEDELSFWEEGAVVIEDSSSSIPETRPTSSASGRSLSMIPETPSTPFGSPRSLSVAPGTPPSVTPSQFLSMVPETPPSLASPFELVADNDPLTIPAEEDDEPDTSLGNAQSIVWQEMLVAQNTIAGKLRQLVSLKVSSSALKPYVPEYLHARIFGSPSPSPPSHLSSSPVTPNQKLPPADPQFEKNYPGRHSLSPLLNLPERAFNANAQQTRPPTNRLLTALNDDNEEPLNLKPVPKGKKERRKEGYNHYT